MIEGVDVAALRRSSVRAGVISLVGALLVLGGIGLSMFRLVELQEEIAALEPVREKLRDDNQALAAAQAGLVRENEAMARIRDELVATREQLEEERLKLTTEIEGLRAERDGLREGMMAVSAALATEGAGAGAVKTAPKNGSLKVVSRALEVMMPTSVRARPRASRRAGAGDLSEFSVWLEMPASVAEQVERVTYLFNHPSFRDKNRTVTEAAGGFRVTYTGWGCLDSVVATIQRKSGDREKMVFNMCELLAREGEESAPEPSRPRPTVAPEPTPGPELERPRTPLPPPQKLPAPPQKVPLPPRPSPNP